VGDGDDCRGRDVGALSDSPPVVADNLIATPCWRRAAVRGLLVIHAVLLVWMAAEDSPVIDEVGHLPAGVSHWLTGNFDLYRVNPPLTRLIAAAPVCAASDSSMTDLILASAFFVCAWLGFCDALLAELARTNRQRIDATLEAIRRGAPRISSGASSVSFDVEGNGRTARSSTKVEALA